MANSKLIVVEGPQGVGKTTITDFLRHSIKYTNLYRLCGTSDSSPTGLAKATHMYDSLLNYIKTLENQSINLLFDRTFFTEEVYSRLNFKEYSFHDEYIKFLDTFSKLDFEIYYITLYLKDTWIYKDRINREGKAIPEYAKFKIESSIKQQEIYLQIADEIKNKYPNINVLNLPNDDNLEDKQNILKEFIKF